MACIPSLTRVSNMASPIYSLTNVYDMWHKVEIVIESLEEIHVWHLVLVVFTLDQSQSRMVVGLMSREPFSSNLGSIVWVSMLLLVTLLWSIPQILGECWMWMVTLAYDLVNLLSDFAVPVKLKSKFLVTL